MHNSERKKSRDEKDKFYMGLALELAKKGTGNVNPNPLVGAVIVQNDKIIGSGYHQKFGGPHAEIFAIQEAGDKIQNATLYVSLEPCAHQGKTPSCASEIIKHGFSRVVVACLDSNPLVSAKGVEIIRDAGIEVEVGLLESEAKEINQFFFKYIRTSTPFVLLKTAMSLDGKIATVNGDSKWISGAISRKYVHELRHKYAAILTGINTVIADDPLLNVRMEIENISHPARIILDSKARIPLSAKIINTPEFGKVFLVVSDNTTEDKLIKLREKGVEIIQCPEIENKIDLGFLMIELGRRGIDSIMVEAGGTVNFECVSQGIVDRSIIFIAPKFIGGKSALTPMEGSGFALLKNSLKLKNQKVTALGEDVMIEAEINNY